MSISVFLPVRKGSVRLPEKNTKQFSIKEGGLLQLKLEQLINTSIDEIILSTDDELAVKIAEKIDPKQEIIRIDNRPINLAADDAKIEELISYAGNVVTSNHILWTHVTSPLTTEKTYNKAIEIYIEKLKDAYDSLISVSSFKNYLWQKEKMIS